MKYRSASSNDITMLEEVHARVDDYRSYTVNVLKFRTKLPTKWHMQTVQTQIRLLLKEQSDQGLHFLPFH